MGEILSLWTRRHSKHTPHSSTKPGCAIARAAGGRQEKREGLFLENSQRQIFLRPEEGVEGVNDAHALHDALGTDRVAHCDRHVPISGLK